MKKRMISMLITCVMLVISLAGCALPSPATLFQKKYSRTVTDCLDTVCTVIGYARSEIEFLRVTDPVFSRLAELDDLFDIYAPHEGVTNLCDVNRAAGGDAVPVCREIVDLLSFGQEIEALTEGKVNILLGAVTSLWHEQRRLADLDPASAALPDPVALAEAAAHTDIRSLVIDREKMTVRVTDPAASLDVGAIAKGWVADDLAGMLSEGGNAHYLINLGGTLRPVGTKPDGTPWTAGIESPDGGDYLDRVSLPEGALATSGAYLRFFTVGGVRYHHIIDPETSYPSLTESVSVTVRTPTAALGDALSTYLFMLSPEEGKAFLKTMPDVSALWYLQGGLVVLSDNW